MKKLLLICIASLGAININAQNINPENDHAQPSDNTVPADAKFCPDRLLSRWCIDANVMGGVLTQQLTLSSALSNYRNAVNTNISDPKFTDGMTYGFDVQAGYFFDDGCHFGIGTGLLYLYQQGNMTMDNFHVEYQSTDHFGQTFRQVLSSNGQIRESITTSNFNIPLVLKYKVRCSKNVGFTADAGVLFNIQEKNSYNTNASFDYEAIYDYTAGGGTVYDASSTPRASDLLITKNQYLGTHPGGDIQNYFNTLRSYGYNVGLGVRPNNNSGNVSYTSGSVGFVIRPAVSFYLSDNVAVNLGAYYIYQNFSNSSGNAMLTDKAGTYNSVMSSVTNSANNSYGISLGVRVFLCRHREPVVTVAPVVPKEEVAPVVTPEPPAKEDTAEVPEMTDISSPIYFHLNKTSIQPEYYPILDEAAKQVSEQPNSMIIINGYADNSGNALYNLALSKKRAVSVKNYLHDKGVATKKLRTIGHGSKSPAASNETEDGRAKNRRVIMKLKQGGAE